VVAVLADNKKVVTINSQDKTVVGTSVCLVPIDAAARFFPGYTRRGLYKLFRALHIPLLHDKFGVRFNLYTLEEVLHYLLRPDGPGLACPGSAIKDQTKQVRAQMGAAKSAVTDADIQAMQSPAMQRLRCNTGLNAFGSKRPRTPNTTWAGDTLIPTSQERGTEHNG